MKVIDQLKTVRTGRVFALSQKLSPITISHEIKPLDHAAFPDRAIEYSTEARLQFKQLGDESSLAQEVLNERAARVIAHELYGDVVQKLFDIRTKLWESGPRYDDEIANMIDDLMDDLQLKDRNVPRLFR